MTRKLYLLDSHMVEFTARVMGRHLEQGKQAVVLDQTCFYPTGGGQPHDTGTLGDVKVVDVLIDETSDAIVHVIDGRLSGEIVAGRIDWTRRFDHMQQHTGQHILSEAFVRQCSATTISFHLGVEASTIDLDLTPVGAPALQAVENLANQIVFSNRAVHARFFEWEQLSQIPLRKPPTVSGPIRVVEVDGFDWSACGGTHCQATGEVGLIRIVGTERRGGETRVTFLCGTRALHDYRRKDDILAQLAAYLTTGYQALPEVVQKMDEESRTCQRALHKTRETLTALEAANMLAQGNEINGNRVIVRSFDDRGFDDVKQLAAHLRDNAGTAVLFGWKGPEKGQLLFARAGDVDIDMLTLLRAACKAVGGGGGGRADLAQGGGMASERVDEALNAAQQAIIAQWN